MIKVYSLKSIAALCFLTSMGIFSSCKENISETDIHAESKPRAVYSTKTLDFSRADGTYTTAAANTDFGNITGWDENNMSISTNTARVKLLKNALSSAGGIVANVDITDGSEYEVTFKVKFHSQFNWGKGGKVGFGFRIGDGNTGCDKADDGLGGSARLMWYDSNGNIVFKPYLYYRDMPGNCGDNLVSSARYPSSGSLQKGVWYTVKIYVKSNTGTSTNGWVRYTIDNNVILDSAIRWTTNDTKRLVNRLAFSTFRGGSSSDWETTTDDYIYFDDLTWTKIN